MEGRTDTHETDPREEEMIHDDRERLSPHEVIQRKLQNSLAGTGIPVTAMHARRKVRRWKK